MKPSLSFKTTTLPAFASLPMGVSGNFFYCSAATAPFKLSFDGGEELDVNAGFNVALDAGEDYRFLVFRNPTAADISISYFTGRGSVNYILPALLVTATNAATYSKGSGIMYRANATYSGLDGTKTRKQFVLTNLDASSTIYVQDGSGNDLGAVFPLSAWTIETSGALIVNNPSGANFLVGELFYA